MRAFRPLIAATAALSIAGPAEARLDCAGADCTVTLISESGVAAQSIGRATPLLTKFDLNLDGDDRAVHVIAVGAANRRFSLSLADSDGGERTTGVAKFFDASPFLAEYRRANNLSDDGPFAVEKTITRRDCRGECELEAPGLKDPDYLFALTGFEFKYPRKDKNIRQVRVWPLEGARRADRIKVSFRDNSDKNEYDVRVSYVLIPKSWVKETKVADAKGKREDFVDLGVRREGVRKIIAGVDFRYTDEDEQLKRFAVDLTDGDARVFFHDNDGKEEFAGDVVVHALCPTVGGERPTIEPC